MRRFPTLSLLLWGTVSCGNPRVGHLPDAGEAGIDLPATGHVVAFGDADCGTAPGTQTLSFTNTGGALLTWTATIVGDGFTIADGASGMVAPGGSAAISIERAAVPATATVGQPITATLMLDSNATSDPIAVTLSVLPHGGSLHIGTPMIGFGQAQLTQSLAEDLEISNTGDRTIQVALGEPDNHAFTASWDEAPAAADLAPAAMLTGAAAQFRPTAAGMVNDTIAIAATGAVCAGDAPTIAVAGEGTTAPVTVAPGTLQFGTTACGATAAAKSVTITNGYKFPIHYTAAITSGPYAIATGQATGTVPASGSATVAIQASAVPAAATSLAANALAGTMTVTTDAPATTPVSLTMAQAATGAVLSVTPTPGTAIAFGDVAAGAPVSKAYSVKNAGNASAPVTVTVTGSGFSATTPGNGTVLANNTDTPATVTETVAQRGALTGTLAVATTAPLCQAAAPGAIPLTATGKAAVASVGSAPAMVALCGATPASVNISVQNTGDEPLVIPAPSLTNGFVATSAFPLTIQPAATGTIAVRPPSAAVGSDVAGTVKTGTLSFTTNEIGSPTHNVALSSTVTGAALAVTPAPGSTIAFGDVNAGTPKTQSFSVANTGNLVASVTVAVTGSGFSATTPGGGTIGAGASQSASVTETVAQGGALSGTLTVSSSTAQCTATPAALTLTATGRTPTAVIGPVPAFSAACGVATPSDQTLTISNTGDGPLTVNATVTGGFAITSTLPITIAAGARMMLGLRPPTAVIGTDVGGSVKTGTLTITTNELANATHTVSLSSTVIGANLVLMNSAGAPISTASFTTVPGQACPVSQTIFIKNTGNAPVNGLSLSPNNTLFQFTAFSPSSSIAAGASVSHVLSVFTPSNNDVCTGSETVQYTAGGTLCTALPLSLQASFNIGGQSSCFCT